MKSRDILGLIIKYTDAPSVAGQVSKTWRRISEQIYQHQLDEIKKHVGEQNFIRVGRILYALNSPIKTFSRLYGAFFDWARDLHLLLQDAQLLNYSISKKADHLLKAANSRQQRWIERAFYYTGFLKSEEGQKRVSKIEVIALRSPLRALPTKINAFKECVILEIGGDTLIEKLPSWIGRWTRLTGFEFRGNKPLKTLPQEFKNLTNLETLDVKCLQLPEHLLSNLKNVALLTLSHLTEIPMKEIGQMKLVELGLNHCSLKEFPREILQLTSLEALELTDNPLESVSPEISRLTKLVNLSLDRTLIKTLPKEMAQMPRLERLTLQKTPIEMIPDEVWHMTNLVISEIGYHSLLALPESAFKSEDSFERVTACYVPLHLIDACIKGDDTTASKILLGLPQDVYLYLANQARELGCELSLDSLSLPLLKKLTAIYLFEVQFKFIFSQSVLGTYQLNHLDDLLEILIEITPDKDLREKFEQALAQNQGAGVVIPDGQLPMVTGPFAVLNLILSI